MHRDSAVMLLSAVILGGVLFPITTHLGADSSARRLPLDLPSGGWGGDEDEENSPESITFYGQNYEGEAFFWCLDKSGSMAGPQLTILKQEVNQAIQSLSRDAEFNIVAFSDNYVAWAQTPQQATPPNKNLAWGWVQTIQAGGATQLMAAGVFSVDQANQSGKSYRTVIVVGDGEPFDPPGTLTAITTANYNQLPVHTILIGEGGADFMQNLAAANQGTYTHIP